jgi:hypothetical protein
MVHLLLAYLSIGCPAVGFPRFARARLTEAPVVRPQPLAGTPTYRVTLRSGHRDYQLDSPPGPGRYAVLLAGAITSGKSKLVFTTPLAPGRYTLDIKSKLVGDDDQTFVFSVPLQGASTVVVSATGKARYDFSFQVGGKKEYRFTVHAPIEGRTFQLTP